MPLNSAAVEQALSVPSPEIVRLRAAEVRNPLLRPLVVDLRDGLSPDEAAVFATVVNPSLRAERSRRRLASAQLLQAGLLPNPQLDFSLDPVTGGNTAGTVTAYGVGLTWDVTSLIAHDAKLAAARSQLGAVRLDVAWQEWQVAQAAKRAVYDLLALRAMLAEAQDVDRRLSENLSLIKSAVDQHLKTLLDLAAAEAASQKAHADLLGQQKDLRHQELVLNQSLGLPPGQAVAVRDVGLPSRLDLPSESQLLSGMEQRRLDLLALKRGYESQEQTVRAAILAQFPKINLGFHQASDTTNVHTSGFGATIELPIFDQNRGMIAIERATRQKLFDEYVGRVFEARAAIAQSLADIRSITAQIADAEAAVPALERLVQAYKSAMGQGNADVLSSYAAQNELAQKRIDLLKLKQQLLVTKVALEIAAGQYLPDAVPAATAPANRRATTTTTEDTP